MENIIKFRKLKRVSSLFLSLVLLFSTISMGLVAFEVSSNAVITTSSNDTSAAFIVPETIYLNPRKNGEHYDFQYLFDETASGNLNQKKDFSNSSNYGLVYFSCDQATSVSINWEFNTLDADIYSGSITLDNSSNNNGGTVSAILKNGYVTRYAPGLIKWTAKYKISGKSEYYYAYNYTYIYNPFLSPIVAGSRYFRNPAIGKSLKCSSLSWISGIHSAPVPYTSVNCYPNSSYMIPLLKDVQQFSDDKSPDTWITETDSGYAMASKYQAKEDGEDGCTIANAGYAILTVDVSRTIKLSQVPNLNYGFMVTDSGNSQQLFYYIADYTGVSVPDTGKSDDDYGRTEWKRTRGSLGILWGNDSAASSNSKEVTNGIKYNSNTIFDNIINKNVDYIAYTIGSQVYTFRKDAATEKRALNAEYMHLCVLYLDKTKLRNKIKEAISKGCTNSEAFKMGCRVLGKPDISATDLKNAEDALEIRTAKATHKTSSKDFGTETKYYLKGDTVSLEKNNYPGYTYDSATKVTESISSPTNLFSVSGFMNTNPRVSSSGCKNICVSESDNSLTFSSSSGSDNYTTNVTENSAYRIIVEPAKTYTFSFNYTQTQNGKITIGGYGSSGNNLGRYQDFLKGSSEGWKAQLSHQTDSGGKFSVDITIPADVYSIAFRFGNTASDIDTKFSNISFTLKNASSYLTGATESPNGKFTYSNNQWELVEYNFIYQPNKYIVHYNPNGASGTMMDSDHTYDTPKALNDCKFYKEYPVTFNFNGNGIAPLETASAAPFQGWTTNDDGTGSTFSNKQSVKNLTSTAGGLINLYAKWGDLSKITIPYPKKTGCDFVGWYDAQEGGRLVFTKTQAENQEEFVAGPETPTTLYAHWAVSVSSLEINPNGGTWTNASGYNYDTTGEDADDTVYRYNNREYGTIVEIPVPVRNGYTFINWSRISTNGSLVNNTNSSTYTFGPENGLVDVLRAIWLPKTYYVTYLSGTVSWESQTSNVKAYAYESMLTAPPSPQRTSFIFDGWDKEIPKTMPAEDLTFTAMWIDEPNAEYNETANVIKNGCAVYLEGKDYSSLSKANYVKPIGITAEDNEIVLNPFNTSKAQAIAFGVKMTDESNAYLSMRAIDGVAYVVVSGTKVDEEGNPVTKVIKLTSGEKSYFDVTDLLEPGKSGYITVRPSGIGDEYTNYSYFAVDELKLTTDNELSDKAKLESIEDSDIDTIQNIVVNIPDNILPIDIPDVIFEKLITKIFIKKTNKDSTNNLDYKTTLTLYNEVENYAGKKITWYVDDGNGKFIRKASNKDGSLTLKNLTKSVKVKCVTKDSDGEEVSSEIETFTVKTGIWQKIVALFRGWFGKLPNVKY